MHYVSSPFAFSGRSVRVRACLAEISFFACSFARVRENGTIPYRMDTVSGLTEIILSFARLREFPTKIAFWLCTSYLGSNHLSGCVDPERLKTENP